jgi:hypothetical protein
MHIQWNCRLKLSLKDYTYNIGSVWVLAARTVARHGNCQFAIEFSMVILLASLNVTEC